MNFLEARRVLAEFAGGPELPFLFALSGTAEPFQVYLEAAGARRGKSARPRFLPFNTLHQHLASDEVDEPTVYLLLPWDLVPETDWRSGVPPARLDPFEAAQRAQGVVQRLRRRTHARFLYLPAPIPPTVGHEQGERGLVHTLDSIAGQLSALRIPIEAFSLGSLFASGCPVGGQWLGRVAELALEELTRPATPAAKVLVTDLDNTVWAGVIAEDGAANVKFSPEGSGYRHYVYQTLLARLRREGAILAAVSRNDQDIVMPPLRDGRMPLNEADFVAVCASYHAKSAQIRQLAEQLNLGLDSFVFVDDNPVEREEVSRALPEVRIVAFPAHDEGLPDLLHHLSSLFSRRELTTEDQERTEMYRRRLAGLAPADAAGADLTRFLAELDMRLVIHNRSTGDRTRSVQLINKTNQFNANGRRWTAEEIAGVVAAGGRLIGASLADRSGSHGEIIACLLGPDDTIEAFVMSCRVFQRQAEFAFLAALLTKGIRPRAVRFTATDRNEPFRQFAEDPAFHQGPPGLRMLDGPAFMSSHAECLTLFHISWE